MSKTYSDQLNKAKVLVAGLKRNYEQIKNRGISLEELNNFGNAISEAEKLNSEVERLRLETSEMVAQANRKLITVKDKALEFKRIVKRYNDISKWADFGVMDKR
jgi:ribosomal protein L13E